MLTAVLLYISAHVPPYTSSVTAAKAGFEVLVVTMSMAAGGRYSSPRFASGNGFIRTSALPSSIVLGEEVAHSCAWFASCSPLDDILPSSDVATI